MEHYKSLPVTGFVRVKDILRHYPVSESHWWSGVQSGKYPQPHKLGPRITAWKAEDIHALIQSHLEKNVEKQPAKILKNKDGGCHE